MLGAAGERSATFFGIAHELVTAVVGWAHQTGMTAVELRVTRGNDAAVRLYETVGFRLTGNHQPLPSDPCKDELRMRRPLDCIFGAPPGGPPPRGG